MAAMTKIRPAHVSDARDICGLVNFYAERGKMLHRSLESIYLALRDFLVAEVDKKVVGCVALGIYWADLAEIKSLAVDPRMRGKGLGGELVRAAIANARQLGIQKLFALTYEKDFFQRQGFEIFDRDKLPEKVWQVCIHCPKADACDETAMMLTIGRRRRAATPVAAGRRGQTVKRRLTRK